MMRSGLALGLLVLISAAVLLSSVLPSDRVTEQIWPLRNLGKAFYENPTTHHKAVEQFEQALALNPNSARERVNYALALLRAGKTELGIAELQKVKQQAPEVPHPWFNLGIVFKKQADYEAARKQFERMVELVPDEPISHYNLGVLYKLTGEPDRALGHFETAVRLDPNLAGPRFQLYNAYRALGRAEEAAAALKTFRKLKKQQAGAAIPEDLDWSVYAEIYDTVEPRQWLGPDSNAGQWKFTEHPLDSSKGSDPSVLLLDVDADATPDLIAWTELEVRIYRAGREPVENSGLGDLTGAVWLEPGDFDNDGWPDLCVLTSQRASIYRNNKGIFSQEKELLAGSFRRAVWLDFDHDYDLDLFLFGDRSRLLRNLGTDGFEDLSERFPFVSGPVTDVTLLDLVKDTDGSDLVVAYADRPAVLYRDRLGGNFKARPLSGVPAGIASIQAQDLDNDGWTDLLAWSDTETILVFNRGGELQPVRRKEPLDKPPVLADLDNDGSVELVSGTSVAGLEGRAQAASIEFSGAPLLAQALANADFDGDGRTDLVLRDSQQLYLLRNEVEPIHQWLQVQLTGVRNLKLAPGAEVEVKSGSLYQKKIYRGVPLNFGLGSYSSVDTVRIIWPNGLVQNEIQETIGKRSYEEKQRLSGSCPMIFTWNGSQFQFITDVLGVAPLGASAGDQKYFPVDHDEYVQIEGHSLALQEDRYEIRITEELREVGYLDQVRLIALDHPAQQDLFTSDKFKAPPFPDFRLFGASERRYPLVARDHHGRDVRSAILRRDRTYIDGFKRDYSGTAELHFAELDFGPDVARDNRSILVLNGWVDWADGSTFMGYSQGGSPLVLPHLQVRDAQGQWQTVVADMGMPAGKPKSIVVDLTGRFLSQSREIRIVSNLCIYWDEIFLSESTEPPLVRRTELPLASAELRFRGFSTPIIHPQRKQPEEFDYQRWMPISMWNPAQGFYTRYGEVEELLSRVDDKLVIMGAGDELRLLYEAASLPALRPGFKRDFLLFVDGWAKDGDLNTAFSQTVEPLPFHAMSAYPYSEGEHYPDTREHRQYRRKYNTRPALRLIQSLSREFRVLTRRNHDLREPMSGRSGEKLN